MTITIGRPKDFIKHITDNARPGATSPAGFNAGDREYKRIYWTDMAVSKDGTGVAYRLKDSVIVVKAYKNVEQLCIRAFDDGETLGEAAETSPADYYGKDQKVYVYRAYKNTALDLMAVVKDISFAFSCAVAAGVEDFNSTGDGDEASK